MRFIKILLLVIIMTVALEVSDGIAKSNDNLYRLRPRHRVVFVHRHHILRRPVVYVVHPRFHRRHLVRRVYYR